MIRSSKSIMAVEDLQQVLWDSSLNPNSFASISPAVLYNWDLEQGGQFTTIASHVVVSGKNNLNNTHLVYIQKKILLFFSYKGKHFSQWYQPWHKSVYLLHFWLFPSGPRTQKTPNPRGTRLCKAKHSTAPPQQTNGKKYALVVVHSWFKKKKRKQQLDLCNTIG